MGDLQNNETYKRLYVLSRSERVGSYYLDKNVAIVFNLYYYDELEWELKYLSRIPEFVDLIIYSSNEAVLKKIKSVFGERVIIRNKENRGRDLSTLLVCFREFYKQYDYFAFIHDKKANYKYMENDVNAWKSSLFNNMICNDVFIENVICTFVNDERLGMLVPPEPYGEFLTQWYSDAWTGNYKKTVELAETFALNTIPCVDKQPKALGSVFWVRRKAISKIYGEDWKYDDFPDEPMPIDGTISHAIERVFELIVEDAGFTVATIMNDDYASSFYNRVQSDMRLMFGEFKKINHVFNLFQVNNYEERVRLISEYSNTHSNIFIFGAGNYGINMLYILTDLGISVSGFIVSDRLIESETRGVPIIPITEVESSIDTGIIIAVSYETVDEVKQILEEHGLTDYIYGY